MRLRRDLIYLEDRAEGLKLGVAPTWGGPDTAQTLQRRLDSLAKQYERKFSKYQRALGDLRARGVEDPDAYVNEWDLRVRPRRRRSRNTAL